MSFEKLPSMKPKGRRKLTSVTFKTHISIVVMLCDAQGRSCSCVNRLQYPVSSASWRLSINLWSRTIQTRVLWTLPVAGKSSIPDLGNYLLVPVADFHFSSPRTLFHPSPFADQVVSLDLWPSQPSYIQSQRDIKTGSLGCRKGFSNSVLDFVENRFLMTERCC